MHNTSAKYWTSLREILIPKYYNNNETLQKDGIGIGKNLLLDVRDVAKLNCNPKYKRSAETSVFFLIFFCINLK